MNKNKLFNIIIGAILFITFIIGIIFAYLYLSNKKESEDEILIKSGVAPGLYSLQKQEKPKVIIKEKIIIQPIIKKEKTISFNNLFKDDKPNIKIDQRKQAILKAQALRLGNSISANKTYTIKQSQKIQNKNFNLQSLLNTKTKGKDFDKSFGLYKDKASKKVKLERVITADKMFSAILITAVNSHLKGKITAMIEDNIYGSHGRNILIPKGSTAIGNYIPLKTIGDERLAVGWYRIITPDGININLSGAYSSDVMGRSGAVGELDNRYFARYGLALSITTVANTISYFAMNGSAKTSNSTDDTASLRNETIRDYKNDVSRISDQILKEQLKIKPTINIDAGTRIFISPINDIWFHEKMNDEILVENTNINKGENK